MRGFTSRRFDCIIGLLAKGPSNRRLNPVFIPCIGVGLRGASCESSRMPHTPLSDISTFAGGSFDCFRGFVCVCRRITFTTHSPRTVRVLRMIVQQPHSQPASTARCGSKMLTLCPTSWSSFAPTTRCASCSGIVCRSSSPSGAVAHYGGAQPCGAKLASSLANGAACP